MLLVNGSSTKLTCCPGSALIHNTGVSVVRCALLPNMDMQIGHLELHVQFIITCTCTHISVSLF